MQINYKKIYPSVLGDLILTSDEKSLTGLYFGEQEWQNQKEPLIYSEEETEVLSKVTTWLDDYFNGKQPPIDFPLKANGTPFQKLVWQKISAIPYGKTTTYGQIATEVAQDLKKERMSAQAVGGAVGSNPISIIVPCHRVIGKNGSVTGYGGGISRKLTLLDIEKTDQSTYFVPKSLEND